MFKELLLFAIFVSTFINSESEIHSIVTEINLKTEEKNVRFKRNEVFQSNEQIDCGTYSVYRPIIHGGTFISRGEYPWKAALLMKTGQFFCGGTLVSNKMVVTAAHCMKGKHNSHEFQPEDIIVLLGVHDISRSNEIGRISSNVKTIQVHPDWNVEVDSYDADIAVLILETEVHFDSYIKPICLDGQHSQISKAINGIVVGFGKTETGNLSNIAKKLAAPILNYHECSKKKDTLQYLLSSRTFCGGPGDGRGVCEGDSGSGLFVIHNNRFYLRGIASASIANNVNECNVNTLAIFTDATDFCGWIRSGGAYKHAICVKDEASKKSIKNILYEGECLGENEYLESYNKCFKIIYQNNGYLVMYQKSLTRAKWSSITSGSCLNKACMQQNGNFEVSDCNNKRMFATNTAGNPGSRIVMQNDGNFVLYSLNNKALWASHTVTNCSTIDVEHESLRYPIVIADKPIKNVLNSGECLQPNEYLESNNKDFKLIYQLDGDFVFYSKTILDDYIWCSHTPNSCTNQVCLLDGNLVLYNCQNKILFTTNTAYNPGSRLVVEDNGRIVIYSPNNYILWTAGLS